MKKLKALHIASFLGNIGDYANHQGFYRKFAEKVGNTEFTKLEIRKFYKDRNDLKFDTRCLDLINSHDLLVLGGGGFFDLRLDHSATGITLDFSRDFIEGIKVPVLVNAMGYHEYPETTENQAKRFGSFLRLVALRDDWLVTLRNDGSETRLSARYPDMESRFKSMPDNGFSFEPKRSSKLGLDRDRNIWIGVNITNDLWSERFNKDLDTSKFNILMSAFIDNVLDRDPRRKAILFPHTPADIEVISEVLQAVSDTNKRERVIVAPLMTAADNIDAVFDLYKICACVIGMRFHANVCCIAMGIPTIGLAGHEQISALYGELGIKDRCIIADGAQFAAKLSERLEESLEDKSRVIKKYASVMDRISDQTDAYFAKIKAFLEHSSANLD